MYSQIYCACVWFIFWYILQKFNHRCTDEWNNKLTSIAHSFLVCRLIEYHVGLSWDFQNFARENEAWQNNVLLITCGYFIFDTIFCVYMETETFLMILHHITSLVFTQYPLYLNMYGYETIVALYIMELTNPLLHFRWFLRSMGLHETRLAFINELVFAVLFLVLRMALGSYTMYVIIINNDTHIFLKFGTICMQTVNAVFSYQILKLMYRKLLKPLLTDPKLVKEK